MSEDRHMMLKRPRSRLNRWVAVSLWPALILGVLGSACSRQDDGDRIRALVARGAAAAEVHDIDDILDLAAADIRAMPMDLDRRGIRAVLWRTFHYYGPLKIIYPRPVVDVSEAAGRASTTIPFLVLKKDRPFPDLDGLRDDPGAWLEAIGESADLYRLRLQLSKQSGEWLVGQATLDRFRGAGFE